MCYRRSTTAPPTASMPMVPLPQTSMAMKGSLSYIEVDVYNREITVTLRRYEPPLGNEGITFIIIM